jgi:hypothetical protein
MNRVSNDERLALPVIGSEGIRLSGVHRWAGFIRRDARFRLFPSQTYGPRHGRPNLILNVSLALPCMYDVPVFSKTAALFSHSRRKFEQAKLAGAPSRLSGRLLTDRRRLNRA